MQQSVFGNLVRSGGLAPRGSGAAGATSHIDDEAERQRTGSVPLYKSATGWATWLVFLALAYVVYRVAVR